MATYAALVSLTHILNRVQNPPPHHVFLKKIQTSTVLDQISFFLDFVENYSQRKNKKIKVLESQILDAAYATEDVIESYIVDQILAKSASEKDRGYATFCEDLQKIVQQMNLIQKEVVKIQTDDTQHFNKKNSQPKYSIEASGTSSINAKESPAGGKKKSTMVGFEEDLEKLVELLITYQSDRLVIPIVGMGGIGKTTLARNTFDFPVIMNNFVIRAWVTISLEYSVREIILGLLYDISIFLVDHENQENNQNSGVVSNDKKTNKSTENLASFVDRMSEKSDEELGEQLYKCLFRRKYLIVLDDIWSSSVWDEINRFLPNNNNGSRIMITTRLSTLACSLGSSLNSTYAMKFLDDDKSWNLLSKMVYGQQQVCPPELEKFGRIIVKNCGGLPLAIVVIGGLLKVSNKTKEYWENVAENVNSIVNTEDDENCLKILSLSYNELPVHLKPLFLYMATFPEDYGIRVSRLIKLCVSEGFLKPPINDKTLEEVALEYLKDLIDRNLIMVQKRGPTGNIKTCHIHDLLRDLCLREAQSKRFFCVTKVYELDSIPQSIKVERRLCVHRSTREKKYRPQVLHVLRSMSLARSLVCKFEWISPWVVFSFSLLRVLDVVEKYSFEDIQQVVNSRYLAFSVDWSLNSWLYFTISQFWNLETLIVVMTNNNQFILPSEIWEMPHIRHLMFSKGVYLADPVDGENDVSCVLNNLQTLLVIKDFRCSEKVLRRIPNLKKLKITYKEIVSVEEEATYCLTNLVHFHKLETLYCYFYRRYNFSTYNYSIKTLSFPPNLKKLVLDSCRIPWENMSIVGSLPNLEVLKILKNAFLGPEWNSAEGEFQSLKFLSISNSELKIWRAESSNFPTLEHLVIHCNQLEEIPWGIGEIPSLQSIELRYCNHCVVLQAKDMLEEQQMQGNDDLHIHLHTTSYQDLQSLASENFHVHYTSWL